jgi:cyclopropane fatty-acyl-phospholipid synthase-like methyltransferase
MSEFWNQRYRSDAYAYGTEPNLFFKNQIENLTPGKILFPAEGEGRNAVYAALLGWDTTAFDLSTEGKRKAEQLAADNNVTINYLIAGYDDVSFEPETFDCIVLIFAHMAHSKRKEYHQQLVSYLKPGGKVILEGFSKKQISFTSGGPREIEMLFSADELKNDFSNLTIQSLEEETIELSEGLFHRGLASVMRLTGIKNK